jgi:hypothetical protein
MALRIIPKSGSEAKLLAEVAGGGGGARQLRVAAAVAAAVPDVGCRL